MKKSEIEKFIESLTLDEIEKALDILDGKISSIMGKTAKIEDHYWDGRHSIDAIISNVNHFAEEVVSLGEKYRNLYIAVRGFNEMDEAIKAQMSKQQ